MSILIALAIICIYIYIYRSVCSREIIEYAEVSPYIEIFLISRLKIAYAESYRIGVKLNIRKKKTPTHI